MKRVVLFALLAAAMVSSAACKRIETRLGTRILDHEKALGVGRKAFRLVSLDGGEPPSTERRD